MNSRIAQHCECSKPHGQKHCRIPPLDISPEDELEPMLNPDGTPMMLLGYPVMQKKAKKP
jgi:hypothetical protein